MPGDLPMSEGRPLVTVVITTRDRKQLADRVEVRSGLVEGDRIVASGVFLLDSESRLRATGGAGGHGHGTPAAPDGTAAAPAAGPHAGH